MTLLQAGASQLYYELHDAQPGAERPTLVLMHGVGGNHGSWFHQVTAWRERYRLLAIDARGFGNSIDAERLGRDRFVDDLHAVLDAAQVGRAIFIGQSMGGGTALSYTLRHPERVAALVLADTMFGIALSGEQRDRMAALTARNAGLTQIQRVLGPTCVAAQPAMATLYTTLASFNRANVRTLVGTQALHPPGQLAATGVPVLFLVGDEDVLFPPAEVQEVQRQVPGSDFVCLPASGHSAYFETPDAFNAAVLGWLAGRGIAL
ncbi:alpha/beta hydrolase [Xylophilus sp. GOD-11R]|uniref:alpha/beta fold hydrolase n=1 Tax=Xylophilus sp. GOD-11R TaxID=3089814 RepID=UPI00298C5281|nr:alpha/beta hydrolase [Xylophilus sp. GOD-11R]WPB57452.1 alpha/beta hydrolase [Xylophilus sp. GOD-11R]